MALPKPPNTTRLLDLNINGLHRAEDYQDILEIGQALKMNSIDLWAFQETNLDWQSNARSKIVERFRQVYHHV